MVTMADSNQPPTSPAEEAKLTATLVGAGLVLLALFGWMGWEFYTAAGSLTWPATEGVVRSFKVWEKSPLGGGKKSYQVEISYEYTVDGQTYTGQTFNSRNNHVDESAVPAIRQQYAAGSKCQVAYSSMAPSQSVLVREVSATAWGKLGIGLAALVGAVFCLVLAFRKEKPATTPVPAPEPRRPDRTRRKSGEAEDY
jgi:hypothetical protein